MLSEELSGPAHIPLSSNNAIGGSLLGVTSMKTDKQFGKYWRQLTDKIDLKKSDNSNITSFKLRPVESMGDFVHFDKLSFEQGSHVSPKKSDKVKVRLKFNEQYVEDAFLIERSRLLAAKDKSQELTPHRPFISPRVDFLSNITFLLGAFALVAFVIVRAVHPHLFRPSKRRNLQTVPENVSYDERDENGVLVKRVGRLRFYPEALLGHGSHGSVVFRGTYNDRPVAVKRVSKHFGAVADREVAILSRVDGHPNVVRFFTREEDEEYLYLALQLCVTNMEDFTTRLRATNSNAVEAAGLRSIPDGLRSALLQVAKGLSHIHAHRIVHRDIKPSNILCALSDEKAFDSAEEMKSSHELGTFVLKISEMGSSRHLRQDEGSMQAPAPQIHVTDATVEGELPCDNEESTSEWRAPELESDNSLPQNTESEKLNPQSADIFSLGCVFYYVLSQGEHPFGLPLERAVNMKSSASSLRSIYIFPDAVDLISRMIDSSSRSRPSMSHVCDHPFFWSAQKRLNFLCEISDILEHESSESLLISSIERNAKRVTGDRWDHIFDRDLFEDLEKYRKYDTKSVRDLLRMIRNKRHHYKELPAGLRAVIGGLPCGYLGYFETRVPNLFMECVYFASTFLSEHRGIAENFLQRKDLLTCIPYAINNSNTGVDLGDGVNMLAMNVTAGQLSRPSRRWWDSGAVWADTSSLRGHPKSHVARASTDFKYRSSLCSHWELTLGDNCKVRKKGKCDFAHGPLELRVKESRRERWGTYSGSATGDVSLRLSGGEDTLGASRSVDRRGLIG